jgi:hypothetical protein
MPVLMCGRNQAEPAPRGNSPPGLIAEDGGMFLRIALYHLGGTSPVPYEHPPSISEFPGETRTWEFY